MVDQQCPEVLDVVAAVMGVESLMCHRCLAGGEGAEQHLHLGGALPGEDALRPLGGAEGIDQPSHGLGFGSRGDELGGEVVTQGAAGAESAAAEELALVAAPAAAEVLNDAGARGACRRAVLGRRAGEQSVLAAGGAGPAGAGGPVEAGPADGSFGPPGAGLAGGAVAAGADHPAGGAGPAPGGRPGREPGRSVSRHRRSPGRGGAGPCGQGRRRSVPGLCRSSSSGRRRR